MRAAGPRFQYDGALMAKKKAGEKAGAKKQQPKPAQFLSGLGKGAQGKPGGQHRAAGSLLSGLRLSLPHLPKPAPKIAPAAAKPSAEKLLPPPARARKPMPNPFSAYWKLWANLLLYNDNEFPARLFSTYLFAGSLLLGIALGILFFSHDALFAVGAALGTALAVHVIAYTQLVLGANSRAGKVEEVLPDFLSLVASNIRSGLTPDKALVVSARDEFGPLTVEINKAAKQSITGMPLDQVMMGMTEHVRSNVLEKTMTQIVEGMHSGGDLAELLERTALDIRKFRSVRKEVNSVILNYELFIVAAITFGAPLLYGVSTFLVDIMLVIKTKIGGGSEAISQLSGSVGIFKGKLLFTPEAVQLFSILAILITVFFGCMAVGVMSSGRRVDGLKYFPILALLGLGLLMGIRLGLSSVLGGLLSGPV